MSVWCKVRLLIVFLYRKLADVLSRRPLHSENWEQLACLFGLVCQEHECFLLLWNRMGSDEGAKTRPVRHNSGARSNAAQEVSHSSCELLIHRLGWPSHMRNFHTFLCYHLAKLKGYQVTKEKICAEKFITTHHEIVENKRSTSASSFERQRMEHGMRTNGTNRMEWPGYTFLSYIILSYFYPFKTTATASACPCKLRYSNCPIFVT